ncbi:MAG TPA: ATP-dependent DNA helicase [Methylomusa anaerophila]|uniref:Bifunctional ATP-dependent DNA helicase/DNA polymerase III subunit epsilon n=1 Tax=Methylomusa anaerophila TaxID=1930071 RepID=A0A348AK78_9FIRM|nr:ATP-dependent DNA helicase [Methylomusa anaerophila]BBB91476.1 bifunctional ATP-dependent DNA helicase/DNA polymerase III subunit epsilon [Methylomusa anaerophila]HML89935.1 ATP-dependent DNA helicase [Methylomusa anaerophila]
MISSNLVRISVRTLVEWILRSGDLVFSLTAPARAVEGTKAHRKVQKSRTGEYQAEVALTYTIEREDLVLEIGGRADGIFLNRGDEEAAAVIDEIKSTSRPLEAIEADQYPLHWAQAKCYAFIYAAQNDLDTIGVQLTYYQLDSREIKEFCLFYPRGELAVFFHGLVEQYLFWARLLRDWIKVRDESIAQINFPFVGYRPGQRELAVAVYKTIAAGRKLYAQAPTGAGKTMATIFPAVKAVGSGLIEKIFFLTAKTVTRGLAEEAFAKLRLNGLVFKTVTLTAKDKICFKPGRECHPGECEYANGHFDRVNGAIADIWREDCYTRATVEQYAGKHRVCPFEFSLDLALWADGVIGDYNYVFDPRVYLRRFFDNDTGCNCCFLIDEAHNLVDRAREMFSAALLRRPFVHLRRASRQVLPRVSKAAQAVGARLRQIGKTCLTGGEGEPVDFFVQKEALYDIHSVLRKFTNEVERWLLTGNQDQAGPELKTALLDQYFTALSYLRIAECYDERYVTYLEAVEDNDVKVRQFCVDPAKLLRAALQRGRAAIFFSATLTPLSYFAAVLGGNEDDGKIAVPSPFSPDNLCLMIAGRIATTYKSRAGTYDRVVAAIAAAVSGKTGNYLVFFPSFQYLGEIYERFSYQYPRIRVIRQAVSMAEQERVAFLDHFGRSGNRPPDETLVGFAVLGGIFGEGIDLVGERLSGAVIVGVGLPQIGNERDIIRDYYNQVNSQGFEFAYMYPGMNKVLQAAGRVIRTEQDRGVVLLIDERFTGYRYKTLFPSEWRQGVKVADAAGITGVVGRFWQQGC